LQGAFGQAQALGQSALAKPGIDEAGGQAQMQALRSKRLAASSARAALRSAIPDHRAEPVRQRWGATVEPARR